MDNVGVWEFGGMGLVMIGRKKDGWKGGWWELVSGV